jgi:hypothetical protein
MWGDGQDLKSSFDWPASCADSKGLDTPRSSTLPAVDCYICKFFGNGASSEVCTCHGQLRWHHF